MKILIAPDKFKGSLTAEAVANAIAAGITQANPDVKCLIHPLADGGDGSTDVLAAHLTLEKTSLEVRDPVGQPILGHYFWSDTKAFVELATASGLVKVPQEQRNPLWTSTVGTGQLMDDAIEKGAREIYLFLGGSATHDGGMGIAHALGFRFIDYEGNTLEPIGQNLIKVHQIDQSGLRISSGIQFYCLCDVKNPLLGPNGAAHVYARQKGASPADIAMLEEGMGHFAEVIAKQTGVDIREQEGGGAAGGISAGLMGLLGASIQSGIDTILEMSKFEEKLAEADVVISGEGKLDTQTLEGKVVQGVLELALAYNKPLVLFVGQNQLAPSRWQELGIKDVLAVLDHARDLDDAMSYTADILAQMAGSYYM